MGKLHDTYQLTISTITPLHIGSGNRLLRDYDYVTHSGRTWVLDTEALAEALLSETGREGFDKMVAGRPASELLVASDYTDASPLFRYVLRGEPRSTRQGAEVQEQLKDGQNRPYIPGSSLKGALRTALAFVGWAQRPLAFEPQALRDNPKFAAQPMEHEVLYGRDTQPNYDLLRIVQVSDTLPDEQKRLQLINVQVTGKKPGPPIELEAIPAGVAFSAMLTLDGYLRKPEVAQELGWGHDDQLRWIRHIPEVVNQFTAIRIDNERERWQDTAGPMRSLYADLGRRFEGLDPKTEFLLQLGWGGGWDSKTFGAILTEDKPKFARVVRRYESYMDRQKTYKQGDRYPKSRRLIVNSQLVPVAPLGWVLVKMEHIS